MRLPIAAAAAGIAIALGTADAPAAEQTIVLGFVCASFESARHVALDRGWEHPATLPRDCRSLVGRGSEHRLAELSEVVEVLPTTDGRWIEIGKVRQSSIAVGYSAGPAEHLLLY